MLLADAWLEDGAVSAWLIPSEFMDVNYGNAVRAYLTERIRLHRIHRFCPTDGQFAEALVSSAVVVFEKAEPGDSAVFSFGGSVCEPQHEARVPISTLRKAAKWTRFNEPALVHAERADGPVLGDFFAIKRGLATGNNDFFILTRERAKELGLPKQYLRPILPPPRALKADVVEADEDGHPQLDPAFVILDCPLEASEVQTRHPKLWAYLEAGTGQNIHAGYLASRRTPWYS
jgi:hypothetical protein